MFRADATNQIGFGHVTRLAALIEELGRTNIEPVVMFDGAPSLATWLARHRIAAGAGHILRLVDEDVASGSATLRSLSTKNVLAIAANPRIRAVVIDGPPLADALVPGLDARGIRSVVVDDRGHCALPIGVVVNHNVYAPTLAASYPAAGRLLLGRDYLMLRRAIRSLGRGVCLAASKSSSGRSRLRVVVTFGGSDPVGATARALRLLPPDRPLDVVAIAGPGFRDRDALHAAASTASDAGHAVDIVEAPDEPGELFATADAALCSAGGALGELAYLGCPALAYAIIPDQIVGAQVQAQDGLIAGGGIWGDTSDDQLRDELRAFLTDDRRRHELAERALATADGRGARRIINDALG